MIKLNNNISRIEKNIIMNNTNIHVNKTNICFKANDDLYKNILNQAAVYIDYKESSYIEVFNGLCGYDAVYTNLKFDELSDNLIDKCKHTDKKSIKSYLKKIGYEICPIPSIKEALIDKFTDILSPNNILKDIGDSFIKSKNHYQYLDLYRIIANNSVELLNRNYLIYQHSQKIIKNLSNRMPNISIEDIKLANKEHFQKIISMISELKTKNWTQSKDGLSSIILGIITPLDENKIKTNIANVLKYKQ